MFKYILVSVISYFLGVISVSLFLIIKNKCKYNKEVNIKEDYGEIAFKEIESREKKNQ